MSPRFAELPSGQIRGSGSGADHLEVGAAVFEQASGGSAGLGRLLIDWASAVVLWGETTYVAAGFAPAARARVSTPR
jgi:hypothetical protein